LPQILHNVRVALPFDNREEQLKQVYAAVKQIR